MGVVSLDNIIDGICIALNSEFGDEYEIYPELVEQGLKPPCFTISNVRADITPKLPPRYYKTHLFCIYYFPEEDINKRLPSYEVKERLYNALEYITVDGDLVRGTKMEGNMVGNDVLAFMVNYDMYVFKKDTEESIDMMGEIDTSVKVN